MQGKCSAVRCGAVFEMFSQSKEANAWGDRLLHAHHHTHSLFLFLDVFTACQSPATDAVDGCAARAGAQAVLNMGAQARTPEWASWSLTQGGPSSVPTQTNDDGRASSAEQVREREHKQELLRPRSSAALATLLRHDADGEDSAWQDFAEDMHTSGPAGRERDMGGRCLLPINADEMDRLLAPKNSTRAKKEEQGDGETNNEKCTLTSIGKGKQRASSQDPSQWRFDPLSSDESKALQRAMRMSNYVPMGAGAEEADDDVVILRGDDDGDRDEEDRSAGERTRARKGTRVNKETGKRVYTTVPGITANAHREARAVLQQLCTSMLPQRHFDWILAQINHPYTDMLGLPKDLLVPATHRAAISQAAKYIEQGSLPLENTAIILHALGKASDVDLSSTSIIDPTSSVARHRGRPSKVTRARMAAQSTAVVAVLKELFPNFFSGETPNDNARAATAPVRQAAAGVHGRPSNNVKPTNSDSDARSASLEFQSGPVPTPSVATSRQSHGLHFDAVSKQDCATELAKGHEQMDTRYARNDERSEDAESQAASATPRSAVPTSKGCSKKNRGLESWLGSGSGSGKGASLKSDIDQTGASSTGARDHPENIGDGGSKRSQDGSSDAGPLPKATSNKRRKTQKPFETISGQEIDTVAADVAVRPEATPLNQNGASPRQPWRDPPKQPSPGADMQADGKRAALKPAASPLTNPAGDPAPAASAASPAMTTRSRRSDVSSAADWKMPLPSFWARPRKTVQ